MPSQSYKMIRSLKTSTGPAEATDLLLVRPLALAILCLSISSCTVFGPDDGAHSLPEEGRFKLFARGVITGRIEGVCSRLNLIANGEPRFAVALWPDDPQLPLTSVLFSASVNETFDIGVHSVGRLYSEADSKTRATLRLPIGGFSFRTASGHLDVLESSNSGLLMSVDVEYEGQGTTLHLRGMVSCLL